MNISYLGSKQYFLRLLLSLLLLIGVNHVVTAQFHTMRINNLQNNEIYRYRLKDVKHPANTGIYFTWHGQENKTQYECYK